MRNSTPPLDPARIRNYNTRIAVGLALLFYFAGCGTTTKNSTSPTSPAAQTGPQTYFAPGVAGAVGSLGNNGLSTFTIDDTAGTPDTFSQTTYLLDPPQQQGPQVLNAGSVSISNRGLRNLTITANYQLDGNSYTASNPNPPNGETGSFALELAGQVAGLVQLVGQPAQPLVAATACPSLAKSQTYQFIAIPAALSPPNPNPYQAGTWDPTTETAYGTVDISSTGETVSFQNIQQFILPSEIPPGGGSATPLLPAPSSVNGVCGPTFFGSTISVPGQLVIGNPGNGQSVPYQATIGIGASGGLLVEDNNAHPLVANATGLPYENVLGAGTGAVGLPQPASPLTTSSVVGAQYLGFIYGAGVYPGNDSSPTGWTSNLASFGFSNLPASCAALTPATGTLIYGGDFTKDDPTTSADGYGNCDFAIDLGTQSATSNGLYPNATVWVGATYLGNPASQTFSFPAVAIAGQINGKFAIFVIGVDSTSSAQPWAVYLLQSN